MPPVLGLFILAFVAVLVAGICLGSLLAVALRPAWRGRRTAWVWACLPTGCVLLAGLSCAISNGRQVALSGAVERGDAAEVRRLLEAGVDADARTDPSDPYGSPYVIHRAIDAQRWDIVDLLVDYGTTIPTTATTRSKNRVPPASWKRRESEVSPHDCAGADRLTFEVRA